MISLFRSVCGVSEHQLLASSDCTFPRGAQLTLGTSLNYNTTYHCKYQPLVAE